jgi:hypothetical protein
VIVVRDYPGRFGKTSTDRSLIEAGQSANFHFDIKEGLLTGWTKQAFGIACIGHASRAHHEITRLAFHRLAESFSGLTNGMTNETYCDCFELMACAAARI